MNVRVDEWRFAGTDLVATTDCKRITVDPRWTEHVGSTSEGDVSDAFTPFDGVVNRDIWRNPSGEGTGDERHIDRRLRSVDTNVNAFVAVRILRKGRSMSPGSMPKLHNSTGDWSSIDVDVGNVHEHANSEAVVRLPNDRYAAVGWRHNSSCGRVSRWIPKEE